MPTPTLNDTVNAYLVVPVALDQLDPEDYEGQHDQAGKEPEALPQVEPHALDAVDHRDARSRSGERALAGRARGGTRQPATSAAPPARRSPAVLAIRPPTRRVPPHGPAPIARPARARPKTAPTANAMPSPWRAASAQNPAGPSRPARRAATATAVRNARSAVVSRSRPSRVRPRRRASAPSSQSVNPPAAISTGSRGRARSGQRRRHQPEAGQRDRVGGAEPLACAPVAALGHAEVPVEHPPHGQPPQQSAQQRCRAGRMPGGPAPRRPRRRRSRQRPAGPCPAGLGARRPSFERAAGRTRTRLRANSRRGAGRSAPWPSRVRRRSAGAMSSAAASMRAPYPEADAQRLSARRRRSRRLRPAGPRRAHARPWDRPPHPSARGRSPARSPPRAETVFDVIAAPYLGRTPRALAGKLAVWERGSDMALAAHFTPGRPGSATTTVETVPTGAAAPPVSFRLLRGPVPHVSETYELRPGQPAAPSSSTRGGARDRPLAAWRVVGERASPRHGNAPSPAFAGLDPGRGGTPRTARLTRAGGHTTGGSAPTPIRRDRCHHP